MSKDGLQKKVINSPILESYALKKDLRAKLDRFDQLRKYMQIGGRSAPSAIRLFRTDWLAIDRIVREQSNGERNAETVTWGGQFANSSRCVAKAIYAGG